MKQFEEWWERRKKDTSPLYFLQIFQAGYETAMKEVESRKCEDCEHYANGIIGNEYCAISLQGLTKNFCCKYFKKKE